LQFAILCIYTKQQEMKAT